MMIISKTLRRRLIEKDRFKKYLLYAIGETILLILGILIALQINNWNDDRKLEQSIDMVRASVKDELIRNQKDLLEDIEITRKVRDSSSDLLAEMSTGQLDTSGVDQRIGHVLGMSIWNARTFAMDELVSTGTLSNIKDQDLKELINEYRKTIQDVKEHVGFLEAQSSLLMDCVVRKGSTLNSAMNLPFMQQEPSQLTNNAGLIQDPEFESRLAIKYISCNFVLEEYQAANEIIQQLINRL